MGTSGIKLQLNLPDTFKDIAADVVNNASKIVEWPKKYRNSDTGRYYEPHHAAEHNWVYNDAPRYKLISGGEGSGKSAALTIKVLERLRRGMSGIMISPNLPHFRRSLWPEFLRWLPRNVVIDQHQRYFNKAWEPRQAFKLVVHNELGGVSVLDCAGAENPLRLEGPNLSFVALDEIRGMEDENILKVLSGRIRITGANDEPPGLFAASTPRMHWMFDYFGPPKPDDEPHIKTFKANAETIFLTTADNLPNLDPDYIEMRGATLTEREKDVRLRGQWTDENDNERFLPDIALWDRLQKQMQGVRTKGNRHGDYSDALVVGLDGAVSRDFFAMVAVSRSPFNREHTALRYVKLWEPQKGQKLNFTIIQNYIIDFLKTYNVVTIVYDEYQLHQMGTELMQSGHAWTQPFNQNKPRSLADQALYDGILQGKIVHDGNLTMRQHLLNADKKMDHERNKRRLAKRNQRLKIDAAVAFSMANFECLRLNL